MHPASAPPPPHTMVVLTVLPHQSLLVQVLWSIRGRWACFSWEGRLPPARNGGIGKVSYVELYRKDPTTVLKPTDGCPN